MLITELKNQDVIKAQLKGKDALPGMTPSTPRAAAFGCIPPASAKNTKRWPPGWV